MSGDFGRPAIIAWLGEACGAGVPSEHSDLSIPGVTDMREKEGGALGVAHPSNQLLELEHSLLNTCSPPQCSARAQ